ncbi:DUF305 domain-containing protein [Nocardioides gilvus]|uniref:DUF305 domain-containing protein n=1 Tax=Nocardioides gilvus TaxID=1735589 RepID=UPI000D74E29E|nr:DUF305 domain-containing protein [Nocardioides gilvus]
MSRRVGWIVAVMAVLVVGMTIALAAVVAHDDPSPGPGDHMGGMGGIRTDSEYAYLTEMVAHHEEAVEAAGQLQRSSRAEMRDFGEDVVATQSEQIDQMQEWLAEWYPDRTGAVDHQPMMRDLTRLAGDRMDQVFLEDMISHHMGAVMMSQQLLSRGLADHDEVEALAESIRDEQHAEIFQMQQWLKEWFNVDRQHGPPRGGGMGMPGNGMPHLAEPRMR